MKKLKHLLDQDEPVTRVFIPLPMVSYRSARKLNNYLVCAKLCPSKKRRGSCKCGNSRCQACNNIEGIATFISIVPGGSFKINHHLCFNDESLVNLFTCEVCKKQYTGKTVDKFTLQQNNYKESDRKLSRGEEIKQNLEHFSMVIKVLKMLAFV